MKRAAVLAAAVSLFCMPAARAHILNLTQVIVRFQNPGSADIELDVDLGEFFPGPAEHYGFSRATPQAARKILEPLLPRILGCFEFRSGATPLVPELVNLTLPTAERRDFDEPLAAKVTILRLKAALPDRAPVSVTIPLGSPVTYPVAYTFQVPAAQISLTRWAEMGGVTSQPFDWAACLPSNSVGAAATAAAGRAADIEREPWYRQIGTYLRLGFHHIVPEGTDHILFVLGLFFLGISWRKLLSQTSVFTVAHATTLFLSTYGIFSLPSKLVEPAIALSICFIAAENIVRPTLGLARLALVFCFGLIHGLGFASSLSEVPFPKHQFFAALLGFNFGVDAGQLFVIALAFLAVGWWRNRWWFRSRIAIPCSAVIALIGLGWAVQRVGFYYFTMKSSA